MTMQIESISPPTGEPVNIFLKEEHGLSMPSATVGGTTFLHPTKTKIAALTALFVSALGTSSAAIGVPSAPSPAGINLILPPPAETPETAAERYAQLRAEIERSGVPLLSDDEIREEIRARRGERDT